MRIIAGSRRGIRLATFKGMGTRPTLDRTKETLFNIISGDVRGCRFLDLYSGSGQIGLEALSRGAKKAVLVEKGRLAAGCILKNIKSTRFEEDAVLMNMDVMRAVGILEEKEEAFDVIFMDPPFDSHMERDVLVRLARSAILNEGALIIVEASIETEFTYICGWGYEVTREKSYKTHKHVFIRRDL